MRLVCVPEDLTLPQLLALADAPPALGDMLQEQVYAQMVAGRLEDALMLAEQVFATAWAEHNRYAAALALFYKVEGFFRLQRWEDALDNAQRALRWLEVQLTPVARHNEAVANYFLGLLHYVLHADEKTTRAFIRAQALLDESERYWGYQNHTDRVRQCQSLAHWMTDLRRLQPQLPPGDFSITLPCYEWVNRTLIRTDALSFSPFEVLIPGAALQAYLPARFVALELDTLPFLPLHPTAHYLALKIPTAGHLLPESQVGDVLIMETTSPVSPVAEMALSTDKPFFRRTDGRILFRPRQQENETFVGIPRLLIREEVQEL